MIAREEIERAARQAGCTNFRWISGKDVQLRQWVRFKCMFGCNSFGKKAACPPEIPSVSECREMFREYEHILVLHFPAQFDDPSDREEWSRKTNAELLKLERAAFLAGHHQAFLLFMDECLLCADCVGTRRECRRPREARPTAEGLGMDVFATVRSLGLPIEVLTQERQKMDRYAFLLVA